MLNAQLLPILSWGKLAEFFYTLSSRFYVSHPNLAYPIILQ